MSQFPYNNSFNPNMDKFGFPQDLSKNINYDYNKLIYIKSNKNSCDICGKEFPNTEFLNSHMFSHSVAHHKCTFCSVIFPNMIELKQHKLESHNNIEFGNNDNFIDNFPHIKH